MSLSLREKKKAETRAAINEAAAKLFLEKGYADTTLSDIAALANVSQRTIFSYFPSKEAILFSRSQLFIDDFIAHIEQRGNMTVFDAIRSFSAYVHEIHYGGVQHDQIRSIINSTPALHDYFSGLLTKLERKLLVLIADERHFPIDSIQAHMVAASIRAIISYRFLHGQTDNDASLAALRFIEGGLKEIEG